MFTRRSLWWLLLATCSTHSVLFAARAQPFAVEETTIDRIHEGIRSGQTPCKQVFEGFVARARAYNGVCTKLVTADGKKIDRATGTGMRLGVVCEFMVKLAACDNAVSDGVNSQLKVLKALGAELVESVDPGYRDDPSIPNMEFTFQHALAEVIPFHMPEVLTWQKDSKPEFAVDG